MNGRTARAPRFGHALAMVGVALAASVAAAHPDGPYDELPTEGCQRCHSCAAPTAENKCLLVCLREELAPKHAEDGPDIVILDELADLYLPVPFDHKGHARMAEMGQGCVICHHYTPEGARHPQCKTCHDAKSGGTDIAKPGLKGAYHRQCLNCHREWTDEKDCAKCHPPRTGSGAAAEHQAVTKDDLLGLMHPPIPEPDTEVYRADRREVAGSLVIFRHREHIHRFGLACVECHHEENCTRCHSEGTAHQSRPRTVAEHHRPCIVCHSCDMDESCVSPERCKRCHWKPGEPKPKAFDHADTGWPLSRHHRERGCRDCHKTVPFRKLERACTSCHAAWSPQTFDHAVTGQLLDANHRDAACNDCHVDGDYTVPPRCDECHDADEGYSFPQKRPGERRE